LGGDLLAALVLRLIPIHPLAAGAAIASRFMAWMFATFLLSLAFAVIYYAAPGFKEHRWHWITPGASVGILGWLIASLVLRIYLHFFNSYSLTYGSLGAVIILLTWFYITGLMLLVGAEINREIEAASL
jgi:membrane protein